MTIWELVIATHTTGWSAVVVDLKSWKMGGIVKKDVPPTLEAIKEIREQCVSEDGQTDLWVSPIGFIKPIAPHSTENDEQPLFLRKR